MRQAGRVNLLVVAVLVMGLFIVGIFFMGRESMSSTCGKFLAALAAGDVDTLTKYSYLGETPPEKMKESWTFTVKEAAPHYRFMYRIDNSREQGADSGAVSVRWWKNALTGSSYDEAFDIPMIKKDGQWKVDVRGMSREMYPGLPR